MDVLNYATKVKEPAASELDTIYEMGFDVWSDGETLEKYLNGCRTTVKYRQGRWLVLEQNGTLISSLLIHSFGNDVFGIGSIGTAAKRRKNGHASVLIAATLRDLWEQQNANLVYL